MKRRVAITGIGVRARRKGRQGILGPREARINTVLTVGSGVGGFRSAMDDCGINLVVAHSRAGETVTNALATNALARGKCGFIR